MPNRIERFHQAIRVLKGIEDVQFDIYTWIRHVRNGDSCQIVCCAIGWMCMDEWFNAHGLSFSASVPSYRDPKYPDHYPSVGFCAVGRFFDIPLGDVRRLFSDEYDGPNKSLTRPKDVIDRLERYIKHIR